MEPEAAEPGDDGRAGPEGDPAPGPEGDPAPGPEGDPAPGPEGDPAPGPDALPADLDVAAAGPYTFPDVRKRRVAGYGYLVVAAMAGGLWVARGGAGAVLVNDGIGVAALVLVVVGAYHLRAAWPLAVRELDALVAASEVVAFAVGHASAQLGWRGLASRPVWRLLVYSAEEPPRRRALVLVDGVDGRVLEHLVEDNPEDWSTTDARRGG